MGHLGDEEKGSAAAQVKINKEIFGAKYFAALMWQSNSKGGATPVPGYKRSKWLPGVFQAAQLSAQGERAGCGGGIFPTFCMHPLSSLSENSAESFRGEIVASVLIHAEASAED